jgi:hypothetical protein
VAGPSRPAIARAPVCRTGAFGLVVGISPNARPRRSNGRSWVHQVRRRDSESSVDDLGTWRGVVLGRAVTTLRSVETQPYAWGFVLSVRRDPTNVRYHAATRVRPSMRTTVVRARRAATRCCVYVRRCARWSYTRHRRAWYEKKRKEIFRYVSYVANFFFFKVKQRYESDTRPGLGRVRFESNTPLELCGVRTESNTPLELCGARTESNTPLELCPMRLKKEFRYVRPCIRTMVVRSDFFSFKSI